MREGLRSRKRPENPAEHKVSDRGVVQKKGHVIKQEVLDFSGEGLAHEREALNLTIEKKEVEEVVKEECELGRDMGTSRNVGLVENGNNSRVLSCGKNIERKVEKEEDSNDKLQIGGRVLRSRLKRGDGKKSGNEENYVVLCRQRAGFEKIQVKAEEIEAKEYISNGYEKNKEGNDKMEFKRKRGRPPKMEMKEQDGKLQRKHGMPSKAGQTYNLMKVAHTGKGKVGFQKGKKGFTMRDGANTNSIDMCSKGRSFGKELKRVAFSPVKTENDEVASPLRSNSFNVPLAEKSGKNKAKQLVREKIMELLTAAGWTVDYRPRNGRIYNDAVYVSLDGKTHWSITLAYNRLKRHFEDGDGEGKVYGPGFEFAAIPEEEFNTLTKVTSKKRASKQKLKRKGGKGVNKVTGVTRKLKREKQGSFASLGKSMKGKTKRKWSLMEEDNTDVTSPNRMVLVKDHKRQKTQNKKRCALLVRDADKEVDSEVDGYVPYNGKRTVLAWMIDMGTVLQNGKVYYMNLSRKCAVLEGRITGDGIHCDCCDEIVTISEFEAHAGSKLSDPLKKIYIEGGTSLLQCLLDSWNKQDESERKGFHFIDVAGEDPNDDTCGVCGDGGDLICCDGCPSTFHQNCLGIKKFPFGDWHCIYCCCKFCGLVGGSTNQSDDYNDFTGSALLTCHSCEQKYHRSCIEVDDAQIDVSSDSFCGNGCQELSERLKMLLGVKHEIGDGFSLTFMHRSDVGSDACQIESQMVECNSKLAVALLIMDECFMPYIDHRSGINLIHSILYNRGSNFNRLNHSGFITAILERGDEIVCAASIRIHGNQLAEMPFIGTRSMYRRQGMCRRLLSAIEHALGSLNVGLLVIPAIAELRETWTSVFGFEPLDLTGNQIIKNMNLLVFPHVDMLQKKIPKHSLADANLISAEVSYRQLQKNQKMHEVTSNCHEAGSSGFDMIVYAGLTASNACQMHDKFSSIESGSQLLDGAFNNTLVFDSETVDRDKCSEDVECQVVCHAVYDNLTVEGKGTIKGPDYVSNAHCQTEDINSCENANSGCIILAHDGKTVDLDNPLNNCRVSEEGRKFLTVSHISSGITKGGHYAGAPSLCTENIPNEAKVADEIVTNSNSSEDSPHRLSESIPLGSQIVSCTIESKDSADSIYHDLNNIIPCTDDAGTWSRGSQKFQVAECDFCSHENSNSCELRSNHGFVQPFSIGSKELHSESINGCGCQCRPNGACASGEVALPTGNLMHGRAHSFTEDLPVNCIKPSSVVSELNADEAEVYAAKTPNSSVISEQNADEQEVCAAKTPNLQTHINSGDCQSIKMASDSCEEIANGVNESSKASSVTEFNFLPADRNLVLNNDSWMDHSSEQPEPGLQVDKAAQSNAPSSCSPNTAGVALHCASAGGTSCGSTEVIVLSNQAS